ncbi:hypothetical protein Poli38472_014621 [Pythium oligandrum]|uniref:Uncharacterized protein n=1 Tax=Pythium oligandrum TaxID=41045 RepID=A0A8K1FIK5_PYTOL|nr:hypothetical protein Poli38472_014621 [Pythium oligandrum]|eukprot:TMW63916.1 hypothetical protein Poli38472_014621 [Pythium oligandrum]
MMMKNTILTVIFSLIATGCSFYSLVYPAWFQQHFKRDGKDVFQGYGIFAFYSTNELESPFYASQTTLQYGSFCKQDSTPNYMLGDGDQFLHVLCGKAMHSVQATTAVGAAMSAIGLIVSVIAVYNPSAGYAEKIVSFTTLVGSILLAVSLVIWGWAVQQRLYQVDAINSAYTICKADKRQWSCWFYGFSFWVCLAAVIILSVAGYMSSAGRAEKIRFFRKEYERDLAVAMQQSMEHDAAAQSQHVSGPTPHSGFARTGTAEGFAPNNQQQQAYGGYQPSNQPYPPHQKEGETAYPCFREEKNHTLLGRQPSGGVV